jgi:hypothetical protein
MWSIPYVAGNHSLMLTSFLRFIVQCSGSMDMRTEIQPHNLMLYDVKQTILRARAAPRMPCTRPLKDALGPNIRTLAAPS